jgi:hypothetical protein
MDGFLALLIDVAEANGLNLPTFTSTAPCSSYLAIPANKAVGRA